MKSNEIKECMLYNTVRLQASNGSYGTGFFYEAEIDGKIIPILVTTKYVANYRANERMRASFHLKDNNGVLDENIDVEFTTLWSNHPTQKISFCLVDPLFQEVKRLTGKSIYYVPIDNSLIYTQEQLESLLFPEQVVMAGYPNELQDELYNYPIFKIGGTATHPAYDFRDNNIGLVDIACFPGFSGSPIYIRKEDIFSYENGTIYFTEARLIFLGVFYSGLTVKPDGKIVLANASAQQIAFSKVGTMMDHGYYIKAPELEKLDAVINIIDPAQCSVNLYSHRVYKTEKEMSAQLSFVQ